MLAIGRLHFQILWRSIEAFLGVFSVCRNGMFAHPQESSAKSSQSLLVSHSKVYGHTEKATVLYTCLLLGLQCFFENLAAVKRSLSESAILLSRPRFPRTPTVKGRTRIVWECITHRKPPRGQPIQLTALETRSSAGNILAVFRAVSHLKASTTALNFSSFSTL